MSFLYRWTFSYYVKGPRGTPLYETEYYYNVRTRRRLSKSRYKKIEIKLRSRSRGHLKRYSKKSREKYGATVEAGKPGEEKKKAMLERTAMEKPSRSRKKGESIEARAIRMRVKEGRAVPTDLYKKKGVEKRKDEDFKSFKSRLSVKESPLQRKRRR